MLVKVIIMVVKSKGPHRRTREKFRRSHKDKFTVNDMLKNFSVGDSVAIKINSSSASIPFRRFYGLTGSVLEQRGNAYIVQIKDGDKLKKIIAKPEHLKVV